MARAQTAYQWTIEVMVCEEIFESIMRETLSDAIGAYQRSAKTLPEHLAGLTLRQDHKVAAVSESGEFDALTDFIPPQRYQRELRRHADAARAADI